MEGHVCSFSCYDSESDESTEEDCCTKGNNTEPWPEYNPFDDLEPEAVIQDLPFALKKLSAMKCQMKKWMLERLELESQGRSMRQALQEYGVDTDKILKPDALMIHFRNENIRLQHHIEELEDKIRDLSETLTDCSSLDTSGCDVVSYVKEKMLMIRDRFILEKRKLRATIANLELRLQEAKDDSCCAALNSLLTKLREVMRNGKKGDQQMSLAVEKSIGTLAELSKSCDELREENKRLLAEVETLKNEIRQDYEKERDSGEIKDLVMRVKSCEASVARLRLQLADRDNDINDLQKTLFDERRNSNQLQHNLDEMCIKLKAANANNDALKTELQNKDDKVSKLLGELRQATSIGLSVNNLESQLDCMKLQMSELQSDRNQLADELKKSQKSLIDKDAELRKLTAQLAQLKSENQSLHLICEEKKKLRQLSMKIENDVSGFMSAIEDLQKALQIQSEALENLKAIANDPTGHRSMDDRCVCRRLLDESRKFDEALKKQLNIIKTIKNYVSTIQDKPFAKVTPISKIIPESETSDMENNKIVEKRTSLYRAVNGAHQSLELKKISNVDDGIDRQIMKAVTDFENALQINANEILNQTIKISDKCCGDIIRNNDIISVNKNMTEALQNQSDALKKMKDLIVVTEPQEKQKANLSTHLPYLPFDKKTNDNIQNKTEAGLVERLEVNKEVTDTLYKESDEIMGHMMDKTTKNIVDELKSQEAEFLIPLEDFDKTLFASNNNNLILKADDKAKLKDLPELGSYIEEIKNGLQDQASENEKHLPVLMLSNEDVHDPVHEAEVPSENLNFKLESEILKPAKKPNELQNKRIEKNLQKSVQDTEKIPEDADLKKNKISVTDSDIMSILSLEKSIQTMRKEIEDKLKAKRKALDEKKKDNTYNGIVDSISKSVSGRINRESLVQKDPVLSTLTRTSFNDNDILQDSLIGKFNAQPYIDLTKWAESISSLESSGTQFAKVDKINDEVLTKLKNLNEELNDALREQIKVTSEIKNLVTRDEEMSQKRAKFINIPSQVVSSTGSQVVPQVNRPSYENTIGQLKGSLRSSETEKNVSFGNIIDDLVEKSKNLNAFLQKEIEVSEKMKELIDHEVLGKFQKVKSDSESYLDIEINKIDDISFVESGRDIHDSSIGKIEVADERISSLIDYDDIIKLQKPESFEKKEKGTDTINLLKDSNQSFQLDKNTKSSDDRSNGSFVSKLRIVTKNLESELQNQIDATEEMMYNDTDDSVGGEVKLSLEEPETRDANEKLDNLLKTQKDYDIVLEKQSNAGDRMIELDSHAEALASKKSEILGKSIRKKSTEIQEQSQKPIKIRLPEKNETFSSESGGVSGDVRKPESERLAKTFSSGSDKSVERKIKSAKSYSTERTPLYLTSSNGSEKSASRTRRPVTVNALKDPKALEDYKIRSASINNTDKSKNNKLDSMFTTDELQSKLESDKKRETKTNDIEKNYETKKNKLDALKSTDGKKLSHISESKLDRIKSKNEQIITSNKDQKNSKTFENYVRLSNLLREKSHSFTSRMINKSGISLEIDENAGLTKSSDSLSKKRENGTEESKDEQKILRPENFNTASQEKIQKSLLKNNNYDHDEADEAKNKSDTDAKKAEQLEVLNKKAREKKDQREIFKGKFKPQSEILVDNNKSSDSREKKNPPQMQAYTSEDKISKLPVDTVKKDIIPMKQREGDDLNDKDTTLNNFFQQSHDNFTDESRIKKDTSELSFTVDPELPKIPAEHKNQVIETSTRSEALTGEGQSPRHIDSANMMDYSEKQIEVKNSDQIFNLEAQNNLFDHPQNKKDDFLAQVDNENIPKDSQGTEHSVRNETSTAQDKILKLQKDSEKKDGPADDNVSHSQNERQGVLDLSKRQISNKNVNKDVKKNKYPKTQTYTTEDTMLKQQIDSTQIDVGEAREDENLKQEEVLSSQIKEQFHNDLSSRSKVDETIPVNSQGLPKNKILAAGDKSTNFPKDSTTLNLKGEAEESLDNKSIPRSQPKKVIYDSSKKDAVPKNKFEDSEMIEGHQPQGRISKDKPIDQVKKELAENLDKKKSTLSKTDQVRDDSSKKDAADTDLSKGPQLIKNLTHILSTEVELSENESQPNQSTEGLTPESLTRPEHVKSTGEGQGVKDSNKRDTLLAQKRDGLEQGQDEGKLKLLRDRIQPSQNTEGFTPKSLRRPEVKFTEEGQVVNESNQSDALLTQKKDQLKQTDEGKLKLSTNKSQPTQNTEGLLTPESLRRPDHMKPTEGHEVKNLNKRDTLVAQKRDGLEKSGEGKLELSENESQPNQSTEAFTPESLRKPDHVKSTEEGQVVKDSSQSDALSAQKRDQLKQTDEGKLKLSRDKSQPTRNTEGLLTPESLRRPDHMKPTEEGHAVKNLNKRDTLVAQKRDGLEQGQDEGKLKLLRDRIQPSQNTEGFTPKSLGRPEVKFTEEGQVVNESNQSDALSTQKKDQLKQTDEGKLKLSTNKSQPTQNTEGLLTPESLRRPDHMKPTEGHEVKNLNKRDTLVAQKRDGLEKSGEGKLELSENESQPTRNTEALTPENLRRPNHVVSTGDRHAVKNLIKSDTLVAQKRNGLEKSGEGKLELSENESQPNQSTEAFTPESLRKPDHVKSTKEGQVVKDSSQSDALSAQKRDQLKQTDEGKLKLSRDKSQPTRNTEGLLTPESLRRPDHMKPTEEGHAVKNLNKRDTLVAQKRDGLEHPGEGTLELLGNISQPTDIVQPEGAFNDQSPTLIETQAEYSNSKEDADKVVPSKDERRRLQKPEYLPKSSHNIDDVHPQVMKEASGSHNKIIQDHSSKLLESHDVKRPEKVVQEHQGLEKFGKKLQNKNLKLATEPNHDGPKILKVKDPKRSPTLALSSKSLDFLALGAALDNAGDKNKETAKKVQPQNQISAGLNNTLVKEQLDSDRPVVAQGKTISEKLVFIHSSPLTAKNCRYGSKAPVVNLEDAQRTILDLNNKKSDKHKFIFAKMDKNKNQNMDKHLVSKNIPEPENKIDLAALRAAMIEEIKRENFAKETLCIEISKEIRSDMKEQIQAMDRIIKYIKVASGKKSNVESDSSLIFESLKKDKWWTPELRILFNTMQELTHKIQKAERDAQNLIIAMPDIKGCLSSKKLQTMRLKELSELHDMIYKAAYLKECDNVCIDRSLVKTVGCRCGVKPNYKDDMQNHIQMLRDQIEKTVKQMDIELNNTRKYIHQTPQLENARRATPTAQVFQVSRQAGSKTLAGANHQRKKSPTAKKPQKTLGARK